MLLASRTKAQPNRGKTMQLLKKSEHETPGTKIGATVSMLLLIAFGTSAFVTHQNEASYHAAKQHNRPVAVSAYLA
jgi:hypothetical protein